MKKDIKFSTRMASADREKIRALAAKTHMSMSDYAAASGRTRSLCRSSSSHRNRFAGFRREPCWGR